MAESKSTHVISLFSQPDVELGREVTDENRPEPFPPAKLIFKSKRDVDVGVAAAVACALQQVVKLICSSAPNEPSFEKEHIFREKNALQIFYLKFYFFSEYCPCPRYHGSCLS
jgi:hypothetical protein